MAVLLLPLEHSDAGDPLYTKAVVGKQSIDIGQFARRCGPAEELLVWVSTIILQPPGGRDIRYKIECRGARGAGRGVGFTARPSLPRGR